MQRLTILFYWLFKNKNNVSLIEILRLTFFRRSANKRSWDYIDKIVQIDKFYEITFKGKSYKLYWPIEYSNSNINMIVCETFDVVDWHYYQKANTKVELGEILLDVGAAEGLFSLSVIEKCSKILIIEPNRLFISSLKKTFSDHLSKIEIIHAATGNEDGIINFSNDSLTSRINEDKEAGESEQIRIAKIDNLGISKITYLKADIEGYEIEMLKGAEKTIKRDNPKIAITAYHPGNDAEEMIKLVLSFVPEYKFYCKGVGQWGGKPVMIHFWI